MLKTTSSRKNAQIIHSVSLKQERVSIHRLKEGLQKSCMVVYNKARAATAAPTAAIFESKTCAAPVAASAEVELVAVVEVGDPETMVVSIRLVHYCHKMQV